MFEAFVVVTRESCELLLVIFALTGAAWRSGRPELVQWAMAGVAGGFAATVAIAAALPHTGMNKWLDIALTFGFGLSLALVSCGTMASVAGIGVHATRVLESWYSHRATGVAVLAFAAFSSMRESLEAVMLLRFISSQEPIADVAWGVMLGVIACGLLAVAWRALEARRGAHWAFRLSAVILFVLGVQMMIEALADTLVRAGGAESAQLGRALMPYLESGDRSWMLCTALAVIPLAVWTRAWWRRAGR